MITTHLVVLSFFDGASTYVVPNPGNFAGYHSVGPYALLDGFSPVDAETPEEEAGNKLGGIRKKRRSARVAGRVDEAELASVLKILESKIAEDAAQAKAFADARAERFRAAGDVKIAAQMAADQIAADHAAEMRAKARRQDDELALLLIMELI